jgi:cytochrome P450 family 110
MRKIPQPKTSNPKTDMKLPNPVKTPALLQMMQWILTPLSLMEDCAQRYGDIFTLTVGSKLTPIVYVSNPQALQEIFTGDSTKQFSAPGNQNRYQLNNPG